MAEVYSRLWSFHDEVLLIAPLWKIQPWCVSLLRWCPNPLPLTAWRWKSVASVHRGYPLPSPRGVFIRVLRRPLLPFCVSGFCDDFQSLYCSSVPVGMGGVSAVAARPSVYFNVSFDGLGFGLSLNDRFLALMQRCLYLRRPQPIRPPLFWSLRMVWPFCGVLRSHRLCMHSIGCGRRYSWLQCLQVSVLPSARSCYDIHPG